MRNRRLLDVAVAVVFEPDRGFFLTYNPSWHGYSFPMRRRRLTDADLGHGALEALRDATDLPLRGAVVRPLVYLEVDGESQRTGEPTRYRYHVFHVDPPGLLSAEVGPDGFARQRGFLKPHEIVPPTSNSASPHPAAGAGKTSSATPAPPAPNLVTRSTRRIVEELIGNQQVAVAVICRRGVGGPEFLMNRNAGYGGYFPIASRCRTEGLPDFEVRQAVLADLGYRWQVQVGEPVGVEERHFSPRFQCERHFVHSLFPVTLPGVDLAPSSKELDHWLDRSGLFWHWVAAAELDAPGANGLSPTIAKIRDGLRQVARQSGCG
jgi:hypothetical protein